MAGESGDRSKYFPAIEAKHGKPVAHWLTSIKKLGDAKYDEQMSFLIDRHGFSRAHANALVMYVRGSTSSRRFTSPDDYFASIDPVAARTARKIFDTVLAKHPDLVLEIAWNQPMLRDGKNIVLGISASKNHLTLGPFDPSTLERFASRLSGLRTNKKTVVVPFDWKVDTILVLGMARAALSS